MTRAVGALQIGPRSAPDRPQNGSINGRNWNIVDSQIQPKVQRFLHSLHFCFQYPDYAVCTDIFLDG